MKKIAILVENDPVRQAIKRFVQFTLKHEMSIIPSLVEPYRRREAFQRANECAMLLIGGSLEDLQRNFQFAKAIGKRTILLLYSWEISIEIEGSFWLVLPEGLDRLGEKMKEIMEHPPAEREEYEKLEERFPQLKERKGHHK